MNKSFKLIIAISLAAVLCACSTKNPDPLEKINRPIFAFNRGVDKIVIRPLASMYDAALPDVAKKGISNAYYNVGEIPIIINNLLQFKIGHALVDTWRLIINSSIGIGGLFDPAARFGLKKNYQDLGLTFSRWGINTPYFVIPLLGPSTLTGAIGLFVDYEFFMIYPYIKSDALRYSLVGGDLLRLRVELLPADKTIDNAFDPYVMIRDAYKQRRAYLLNPEQNKDDVYVSENAVPLVN